MQLLALLALALALAVPIPQAFSQAQEAPTALSKSDIKRLVRSLETGSEERAEEAAQQLLAEGTRVLRYLPDSLVRADKRWRMNEGSLENAERIRGLRLMIAASHADAFDVVLKQAGDPRAEVRTRSQHALAVLPGNPAEALMRRWPDLSLERRENSIMALIAGGGPAAQDHLVAVVAGDFNDSVSARFRAAMGLRAFVAEDDAIAALDAAVADPEWAVVYGACSTLWSYGKRGVPGLLQTLEGSNELTNHFASALLADLGDDARPLVVEALAKSPLNVYLLRVACVVAPEAPETLRAFLALRGNADTTLQAELVMATPELDLEPAQRIEILAEAMQHSDVPLAEHAVLSSLRLPDDEFSALSHAILHAWQRPDATELLITRVSAAIARMALPPEEHLDWCDERMVLPDPKGRLAAGILAASIAPVHSDALVAHIRKLPAREQQHWLPALVGLEGAAHTLLLEAANGSTTSQRPIVLGYIAMGSYVDKDKLSLLRPVLADPKAPAFRPVLSGLAQFGFPTKTLLDPALKAFDTLRTDEQALVLRAAARCDPESKRLAKTARKALAESPSDTVRSAAAEALSVASGSAKSRIKQLQAALKRGGRAKEGKRKGGGSSNNFFERDLDGGLSAVAAIATSLAKLEANEPATVKALGANILGGRHQVIMVAEALRKLSPASASQGESLSELVWQKDMLSRTASLRALVEIEGAGVHADVTLASIVLLQPAELAALALDGLEALSPEDRPFAAPYLQCATLRNTWPINQVGWIRAPLEDAWAKDYEIPGALRPNTIAIRQFEEVRARAHALLAE